MDVHQQWCELGTEALIVVRTTQSTLIAEFKECDATYRAAGLIETTKLLRRLPDLELLHQGSGQRNRRLGFRSVRRCEIITCVIFAEVQLERFGFG